MRTMSDLPEELVAEILPRVPITSIGGVRSTCKKWNVFSKNRILGKEAAAERKQFLGFMMMDYKLCSLRFDLHGIRNDDDFVDPSIKQIGKLNQVQISQVFHCDGLLLCVVKDNSRLLVWNPYLAEIRWIQPRNDFKKYDSESFGPPLRLPIHSNDEDTVTLSCVRDEKLALLYQRWETCQVMEVWVTTKIKGNEVSWSKFLEVDMGPLIGFSFDYFAGSFFIDEETKVAVVFDLDGNNPADTNRHQTAYIIGQDGYFKSVNIGEAPNLREAGTLYNGYECCLPLVCSSYVPSLVQL